MSFLTASFSVLNSFNSSLGSGELAVCGFKLSKCNIETERLRTIKTTTKID